MIGLHEAPRVAVVLVHHPASGIRGGRRHLSAELLDRPGELRAQPPVDARQDVPDALCERVDLLLHVRRDVFTTQHLKKGRVVRRPLVSLVFGNIVVWFSGPVVD